MIFNVSIENVQHIKNLEFQINLSKHRLYCITGKNSVGKTTLVRAIRNIRYADTFLKTASPYIFSEKSKVTYKFNKAVFEYKYVKNLNSIDSKHIIQQSIKENVHVELPIPHGDRFSSFQKLGGVDEELRKNIVIGEYKTPHELISFLKNIYRSSHYNRIKETTIRGNKYYFFLNDNGYYIREDYLSSGEYFLINLFKIIQRKCKLIVIDEIEISLDADAQANLIESLREFCAEQKINIVVTTHSLPLMKNLESDKELLYMEMENSIVSFRNASYQYVRSVLYGYIGWDKYILTEDKVLQSFLEYLLKTEINQNFFIHKILYAGGGREVIDLLLRNEREQIFAQASNVIAVLDGDQSEKSYCKNRDLVYFLPFESVEKELDKWHKSGNCVPTPSGASNKPKSLYKNLIKERKWSEQEIFQFLCEKNCLQIARFKNSIQSFLNP